MTEKESIRCPVCWCRYCPVVNTYPRQVIFRGKAKTIIRRRRVCRHCGLPFYTIETYEAEASPGLPEDASPLDNGEGQRPEGEDNPYL